MTFTTQFNQYKIPHEGQPNWGDEIIAAWKDLDGDMRGITDAGIIKDVATFGELESDTIHTSTGEAYSTEAYADSTAQTTAESVANETVNQSPITPPSVLTDSLNANQINQQHIVAGGDDIQATLDSIGTNDEVVIQGNHTISTGLTPPDDCVITLNGTITLADGVYDIMIHRGEANPIHNFTLRGKGTLIGNKQTTEPDGNGYQQGIALRGVSENIHIKDIEIRNIRDAGMAIGGGPSHNSAQSVFLENLYVHDCGLSTELGDGIYLQADDLLVDNCLVKNVTDTHYAIGNCQRFVMHGCVGYNESAFNTNVQQAKEVVGLGTQHAPTEGTIIGCVLGNPGVDFSTIREFSTTAPRRVTISGNFLYGDALDAIHLQNSPDCIIDGNTIRGPSRHGIAITNSTVTNNIIKNPGTNGIDCSGTGSSAIITGNKITGAGNNGLVSHISRTRVSDNTIINGAGRGIDIYGNNSVITGNNARNNASYGINLTAETQDCIINSNIAHKNGDFGIRLASGNNFCVVTANNLRDNTTAGIGGTVTADSVSANNIT